MHRRNQTRMHFWGTGKNISLTDLLQSCSRRYLSNLLSCICKNKVLNRIWCHLDLSASTGICYLLMSLMHLFIYCEQTVSGDIWKLLFFPSLRPWEPLLSTTCICVLLRNAIIKCPNHYDLHQQQLLKDFLYIIDILLNMFATHSLNLNAENADGILDILTVCKWKMFLTEIILFCPYQVSEGINNLHYGYLKNLVLAAF